MKKKMDPVVLNSFDCNICLESFTERSQLKVHAFFHTGRFQCGFCEKRFFMKVSLIKHTMTHTGEKRCKCTYCGKWVRNLNTHSATHTGEKRFECEVCGKRYLHLKSLDRHRNALRGEKPFQCGQCGKYFMQTCSLRCHFMKTHMDQGRTEGSKRGNALPQRKYLSSQVSTHQDKRKFECVTCRELFTRRSSFEYHMMVHAKEKQYRCRYCTKQFSEKAELKYHMLTTHTDHEGDLGCLEQGKYSIRSIRSPKTSLERRKYKCKCGKRFIQMSHLCQHAVTHLHEKLFECDKCRMRFARTSSLAHHKC